MYRCSSDGAVNSCIASTIITRSINISNRIFLCSYDSSLLRTCHPRHVSLRNIPSYHQACSNFVPIIQYSNWFDVDASCWSHSLFFDHCSSFSCAIFTFFFIVVLLAQNSMRALWEKQSVPFQNVSWRTFNFHFPFLSFHIHTKCWISKR